MLQRDDILVETGRFATVGNLEALGRVVDKVIYRTVALHLLDGNSPRDLRQTSEP